MSSLWRIAGALLVALTCLARDAGACICTESAGLAADFGEASAVFAGEIVALELVEKTVEDTVVQDMVATFRVVRRWKGPSGDRIRVKTCGTQASLCTCGAAFALGKRFVVFASGKPLETSSCDRTTDYFAAPGDPEHQWLGVEDLVRALDAETKGKP